MSSDTSSSARATQLLDVLVVILESWKILLIFPICAGLIAFGICKLQSNLYEAKGSLLMLPMEDGPNFPHAIVVRALTTIPNAPAIDQILTGLHVGVGEQKFGYVVTAPVTLALPDPKMASNILRAIMSEYQNERLDGVREEYKSTYHVQLNGLQQEIAGRTKAIQQIERLLPQSADTGSARNQESVATIVNTLVALRTGLEDRERKAAELTRKLQFTPNALVTNWPTRAILVQGPRTAAALVFVILAAGLAALAFVFMRDIVHRQTMLPGGAEKMRRIQRALHLRPLGVANQADDK